MELTGLTVIGIGFLIVVMLSAFFYFIPVRLWITALASRVKISIISLIGMRPQKYPSQINC